MKICSSITGTIGFFCLAGGFSMSVLADGNDMGASLSGGGAVNECSYQRAQDGMLRFNNIMQKLNLEIVKLQASGESIPSDLREKLTVMVDQSTPFNEMMGEIPSLDTTQANTAVDPAICQGYESLIAAYGGTSDVVKVHKNPECDQTSLWTRYMDAMQTVTSAFQNQQITREEVDQFRVMDVQIGQYSTTDLGKACEILTVYESQVNAIQ